jgi:agmatine deiminase
MNSEFSVPRSEFAVPSSLGYRMPAEWESHAATWLSWPRKDGISFPDKFEPVPQYWVTMCKLLSQHEEVHINTFNDAHEEEIRGHLSKAGLKIGESIFLHRFPAYEPWCRDHGPIFLIKGSTAAASTPPLAIVDWGYNAWGDKYPPYDLDDAVPQHVSKLLNVPLYSPGIVMEGGALDVNGKGTLLTTESCLLNKNRNPKLSKDQIEGYLKDYLGVRHVLWLGDGIDGDDTDGHVDDLTRFVAADTVVTVVEDDPQDVNFGRLQDNLARLRKMKDQDGNPLKIVVLPMPGIVEHEGQRLPASYANFYIANEIILLPVFGHANDPVAERILQDVFRSRKVVSIDCRDLIWGLGSFHCVTQQQPRVIAD